MATISVVKLKVRRGTDSQRQQIVLDQGEMGYVTDSGSQRLFVGDGFTTGGVAAGVKLYLGSITETNAPAFQFTQTGDLVYNTDNSSFYTLTGTTQDINGNFFPDYTNPQAYQFIGPVTDNATIKYTSIGNLTVVPNSINENYINSSAFDLNNGFARSSSSSPFRVNYDNTTIKVNNSHQLYVFIDGATIKSNTGGLYVDPAAINLNTLNFQYLPTTRPTPGSKQLWIDTLSDNTLKIAL